MMQTDLGTLSGLIGISESGECGNRIEGATSEIPEGGSLKCFRSSETGDLYLKIEYSREQMKSFSASPLSRQRVANFRDIVTHAPELIRKPPSIPTEFAVTLLTSPVATNSCVSPVMTSSASAAPSFAPPSPAIVAVPAVPTPRRGPITPVKLADRRIFGFDTPPSTPRPLNYSKLSAPPPPRPSFLATPI
ncbi:unnamed protein product [Caenorhabditis auriculariae]|uniref:Uncharacterized protein n=1 Tax=Caenorhabditis auriculariae TaxID=2777116 RepID=A0A8S1HUX3_9PELO|nr:unnamed protein product [Caenorhabditis auriculariae]